MADRLISYSAMVTAVVAVVIAVAELQANRKFQRLSVEPYLELSNTNRNGYERLLINSGLGPARIKSVDVKIEGKTISNWKEAVEVLTGDVDTPVTYGGIWNGRQLRAEEEVVLVHLTEKETARKFHMNVSKMNMKICYCSIYDDCWLKEDSKRPASVNSCPSKGRERFPVN